MKTSTEYQAFANECRQIAQQHAQTEHQRKMLEEMAQAWDELADEPAGGTTRPS